MLPLIESLLYCLGEPIWTLHKWAPPQTGSTLIPNDNTTKPKLKCIRAQNFMCTHVHTPSCNFLQSLIMERLARQSKHRWLVWSLGLAQQGGGFAWPRPGYNLMSYRFFWLIVYLARYLLSQCTEGSCVCISRAIPEKSICYWNLSNDNGIALVLQCTTSTKATILYQCKY